LLKNFKTKSFPAIIVRLFQVYGNQQDTNKIIPFLINNCKKNQKFNLTHGNQTRDFCHIDDVIDAIFLLLKSSKKKKVLGQIFNVSSGKSFSIKNVAKLVKEKMKGGNPVFGAIKFKNKEIMHSRASIKKIYKVIGWRPKKSLNVGIEKIIKST